jgi:hypothetical protein
MSTTILTCNAWHDDTISALNLGDNSMAVDSWNGESGQNDD